MFDSENEPDLDSVWNWYEFQTELISDALIAVLRELPASADLVHGSHTRFSRFVGLTRGEVRNAFDAQRSRLDRVTMFELLATSEAILRIECKTRAVARKKDGLSGNCRRIQREMKHKIRLAGTGGLSAEADPCHGRSWLHTRDCVRHRQGTDSLDSTM